MSRRQLAPLRQARRAPAALLALAMVLPGCGTCLLVVRHATELRHEDGRVIAVHVDYQPSHGLLWSGDADRDESLPFTLYTMFVGLLCEPIDIVVSTGLAAASVCRDADSVAGGPFGWIASLTPFATLVPALELPPGSLRSLVVDGPLLARLQGGDVEAAREVFHDRRIRGLTFP